MGLNRVTEFGGVNGIPYFDATNLKHGGVTNKVLAYLVRVRGGTDVYSQGYVTFYLKDCRNNILRGAKFNVMDYTKIGYFLVSMKKSPVVVEFTTSQFRGELSLNVISIEPWEGEFDYELFVGRLPNAGQLAEQTRSLLSQVGMDVNINQSYITDSYTVVCNGQAGGYLKLMHMVCNNLWLYADTPGVNIKDVLHCALLSLSVYSKYLLMMEKIEVPLKSELLRLVYNVTSSVSDEKLKNIAVDCASATLGLTEPDHLYAHMISSVIKQTQSLLGFSYDFPIMLEGSSKKVDGGRLSKY